MFVWCDIYCKAKSKNVTAKIITLEVKVVCNRYLAYYIIHHVMNSLFRHSHVSHSLYIATLNKVLLNKGYNTLFVSFCKTITIFLSNIHVTSSITGVYLLLSIFWRNMIIHSISLIFIALISWGYECYIQIKSPFVQQCHLLCSLITIPNQWGCNQTAAIAFVYTALLIIGQ